MAIDTPAPTWRNFAAWTAAGALVSALLLWAVMAYLHQNPMDAIVRPTKVTVELALALILSGAVSGFSNRKRPVGPRTFRNFLILNGIAIAAFLLVISAFSALARTHTVNTSEWVAAATGATLVVVAVIGGLLTASTRTDFNLVEDDVAAEEMRERVRLHLCSFAWMVAYGLLLIGLGLAGPGGLVPQVHASAGALVLIAVLTLLTIAAWRLQDELGRTLSHETGNMAFYLILTLGGGWAILAHLGFVAAPAPLDWLTLFTVLLFAASIIVLARRKLLVR